MTDPEESQSNRIVDISVPDPVCGMAVDPAQSRGKATHDGQTYYFCAPGCLRPTPALAWLT